MSLSKNSKFVPHFNLNVVDDSLSIPKGEILFHKKSQMFQFPMHCLQKNYILKILKSVPGALINISLI